jgi:hypothetical protein
MNEPSNRRGLFLIDLKYILWVVFLFNSPFVALIALILFRRSRSDINSYCDESKVFNIASRNGGVLGLLDIAAYFLLLFFELDGLLGLVRIVLLLMIFGAWSGIWIAWQVTLECRLTRNSAVRYLPSYTLQTLILAVLSIALLMLLFKPL